MTGILEFIATVVGYLTEEITISEPSKESAPMTLSMTVPSSVSYVNTTCSPGMTSTGFCEVILTPAASWTETVTVSFFSVFLPVIRS